MSKILFICEGEKTEKKFCNLIIEKYFIQNQKEKEYVAFKTNIYGLYDEMAKDKDLDVVSLIMERAKQQRDMYNYNKLKRGNFAEIYLIFDFDPHAPQYDDTKIKEMVNFFDNETTNGKLYVNYPMFESFKHFKSLPDVQYNNYTVKLEQCINYKEYVDGISKINHFNDIDEQKLSTIVCQNLKKYSFLSSKNISNYNLYLNNFSQLALLQLQQTTLKRKGLIHVINTSVFWGIDYFGERVYKKYFDFIDE